MKNISCVVRLNKNNELELFYYGVRGVYTSFTRREGHNDCSYGYYLSTSPNVDKKLAQEFVDFYNSIGVQYDATHLFVLNQRIVKTF